MNVKSRIKSILTASSFDSPVSGFPTFKLSELNLVSDLNFPLPDNVRLGHLVEKIVSECLKSSTSYKVVYENLQVLENKITVGEIDFILEHVQTKKHIHLELAYKFYLLDPSISETPLLNWIGPNRNDSLNEKLEKLKKKQFPLLYRDSARTALSEIDVNTISQQLCFLTSFFIPYAYEGSINTLFEKAIKGYYSNFETFKQLHNSSKTYCIPSKKEWGIDPSENNNWVEFDTIEKHILKSLEEKQAVFYWENNSEGFAANFIVWW